MSHQRGRAGSFSVPVIAMSRSSSISSSASSGSSMASSARGPSRHFPRSCCRDAYSGTRTAYGPVHRNGGPTASWASCDGRYARQAPRVMEGFTAPPYITGLEHPCRLETPSHRSEAWASLSRSRAPRRIQ